MGSSGEAATAEPMKGERVVCRSAAVSTVARMEKLCADEASGLSPCVGGLVGLCVRVHGPVSCPGIEQRQAGVSRAGLCGSEACAWGLWSASHSVVLWRCQQIHSGPLMCGLIIES